MNLDDHELGNKALDNKERLADQWLEAVLKQYSAAEPRSGLEERLLRNLHANPVKKASGHAWFIGATAVAAILLLAAAFMIEGHHKPAETVSEGVAQRTIHPSIAEVRKPGALGHFENGVSVTLGKSRNRATTQTRSQSKAQPQWPSQFPSPQPLSEQEQLLAQYVNEKPKEAQRLARATTELLEQEMQAFENQPPILKNSMPE